VIISSPTSLGLRELSVPPLETGSHGWLAGWLRTVADVMLRPGRFFTGLGEGPLAKPLLFALLSAALPVSLAELGALQQGDIEADRTTLALLRVGLVPPLAVAWIAYVQAFLWRRTLALFKASAPSSIAARAMLYLTAVAATLGLLMTLTGFAPESGPCVIAWYASLNTAYIYIFYALTKLARGPYALSRGRAILAVATFELAYAITLFITALAYFAATAP